MKRFLIVYFFLIKGIAFAQTQSTDSLKYIYNDKLMYRMGSSFRVGTEKFTFNQLEEEFKMSELGLDSYKKAKKNKTISLILSGASILSGLVGITYINNNRNAAYTLIAGQFVLSFAAGYYNRQYNEWLDRAIWQRNKDLLFPK